MFRRFVRSKFFLTFTLSLILAFFGSVELRAQAEAVPDDPALISAGESLFKNNCQTCHRVHQKLVGPALADVYERRDLPWIYAFVRNSQKVIQSGDEYAVQLYEEYNQTLMTSFDFSDDEILSILAYVKQETLNPPVEAAATTADGVATQATPAIPQLYLYAILAGLLIVLILILVALVLIVSVLQKYLQQQEDSLDSSEIEVVERKFSVGSLLGNRAFIGMVAFVFTAILVKAAIDGLFAVGVQEGYAPAQPIAFSHKIHAGQYEIECQYCHTGVMKSASANIPSANICMNCHSQIKIDSKEIQKIYAAVENDQPIEWVRVHNLPDLAYFNHAQHVNVGQLDCTNCHGEVAEMEVIEQASNLTMGWCINCHRETELKTKDNAYYDKLVELHNSKEPMTVEDNGGLECAKCHY